MKKYSKFIVMGLLLIAIAIGFIFIKSKSNEKVKAEMVPNKGTADDKYAISITYGLENDGSLKKWDEVNGIGAQYDIVVYNNTSTDLDNWSITLTVPEGSYVQNLWNGSYKLNGTKLYFTPMEDIEKLPAGYNRPFGFILITPAGTEISDFTKANISAEILYYKTSPLYVMLIIAAVLWTLVTLAMIVHFLTKKYYEAISNRDHEITVQSINTFANFIDAKDQYTRGHSKRVALYSKELAKRLGFSKEECNNIFYIALMHDVGKIGVADSILNKAGPLTMKERKVIESHTTRGGEMLKSFTALNGIVDGALYHHERYDGKGYPKGLRGQDIPLYARIICVADSYDAMSSNRCYRPRLETEQIISELDSNAGSQFDPEIVPHMIDMINDGTAVSLITE